MRKISKVIIHCSRTQPRWMSDKTAEEKRDEIKRWHVKERGCSDIGYHYVIDWDGTVVAGRPLHRPGAHTRGHNRDSIGICLIGGHGSSETDTFADNFTREQELALIELMLGISAEYPAPLSIHGHNEFAAKPCSGFNVKKWWGEAQDKIYGLEPAAQNPTACPHCGKDLRPDVTTISTEEPAEVANTLTTLAQRECRRRW